MVRQYTIADGLPSNRIYQTVDDDKGTLWIATDNGISRFDGKYFHNYSTADGLLSNDVIQIEQSPNGTIWANSYNGGITYFDDKENKFKLPKGTTSEVLNKWKSNTAIIQTANHSSLIAYFPYNTYSIQNYIVHDESALHSGTGAKFRSTIYKYTLERVLNKTFEIEAIKLYTGGVLSDSITLTNDLKTMLRNQHSLGSYNIGNQSLFATEDFLLKFYCDHIRPFRVKCNFLKIKSRVKRISVCKNFYFISFEDGSLNIIESETLKLIKSIEGHFNANRAIIDNKDNFWISTNDRGLLKFQNSCIKLVNYKTSELAACTVLSYDSSNKQLLIGTEEGKLFSCGITDISELIWQTNSKSNPINAAFASKKRLNIVSYFNVATKINDQFVNTDASNEIGIKCCAKINDSLLLLGGMNSHANLAIFNTIHNTFERFLFKSLGRVYCLTRQNDSVFIVGSTYGLHTFNINQHIIAPLIENRFDYIVTSVLLYNNILWVATTTNELWAIKGSKIIFKFKSFNENQTTINCIKSLGEDRIIIGTNKGAKLIKYKFLNGSLNVEEDYNKTLVYLSDQNIKCIEPASDSILFASTSEHLYKLNFKTPLPSSKINLIISSINIDGRHVALSNNYVLPSGKKHFEIRVVAGSLTDDFQSIQYAVDDTMHWQSLEQSKLIIDLDNGSHSIFFKAKAYDAVNDSNLVVCYIEITTPFYRKLWFIVLTVMVFTLLLVGFYNRRKFLKQQRLYDEQLKLEHQRQKLTADLHDDIGASLSSLQINSAIAKSMLQKNLPEAEKMLSKVEEQSHKVSEKIGDFIWSMKPDNDKFMTLSNRIRTYAADILGAGSIDYTISIDETVNLLVKDFAKRKNIVLITKEAINNAAKYSKAKHIAIQLRLSDGILKVSVTDDGVGMDTLKGEGNGLLNMQSRVKEMGGVFEIKSSPGNGTSIIAVIPVP